MRLVKANSYQEWKDAEEKNKKKSVKSAVKIFLSGIALTISGNMLVDGIFGYAQATKSLDFMNKLDDLDFSTIKEDNTEESEG